MGRAAAAPSAPSFAQVLQNGMLIGLGQFGPSVLMLQQLLAALSYASPMSGIYDPATMAAMQRFQGERGFTANGQVDARTLRMLETLGGAARAPRARVQPGSLPRTAGQSMPRAAGGETPAGGIKAGVLAIQPRQPKAVATAEVADAPSNAYLEKKEKSADLALRHAERELDATTQELGSLGIIAKITFPGETKVRREKLANQYLPELRAARSEYQTAKNLGVPATELEAKLDRYFSKSVETREFVKGSLDTERGQFAQTDKTLDRAGKTARVVRDVSLGTAAALSTGGGALLVGGVVAGGAVVKTASDEADKRISTGQASSVGELAQSTFVNAAGLTVDAAAGGVFRGVTSLARAGQIGTGAVAAASGVTAATSGVVKRALDGDTSAPTTSRSRARGRTRRWPHDCADRRHPRTAW